MAELNAALDDALAGRGRVIMLAGEPGIGKTRLAEELAAVARGHGAEVRWGRCPEERGAPPFWPWAQVISAHVEASDPDALRAELGRGAAAVAEIAPAVSDKLPGLAPVPRSEDPESARFRLFNSVTTFIKSASQGRPLLIVLDDLHWADASSLKLLEFAAAELAQARVLLVGTYRDTDVAHDHPLFNTLGDLSRQRTYARLLLRGLDESGVGELIKAVGGVQPSLELAQVVRRQTEGNPLFVGEVVRVIAEEGLLTPERMADLPRRAFHLPEGVRAVIGRRLSALPPDCIDLLRTAALIGREFTAEQVGRSAGGATEAGPRPEQVLETLV